MTNFLGVEFFCFSVKSWCIYMLQKVQKVGPHEWDDALRHFHFMQIKLPQKHAKMGLHDQNCMRFQNMYFTNAIVYSANADGKKHDCFKYYTEPLVRLFIILGLDP